MKVNTVSDAQKAFNIKHCKDGMPIGSIATLVTPQASSQSARSCRSWVIVLKAHTDRSPTTGFAATLCPACAMSIVAAAGLTIFSSEQPPAAIFVLASP